MPTEYAESELAALKSEWKEKATAWQAETDRQTADGYVPSKEDVEKVNALAAAAEAAMQKAEAFQEKYANAHAVAESGNRLKANREAMEKFERFNTRQPDYTPAGRPGRERHDYQADCEVALNAWMKASVDPEAVTEAEVAAAKRVGVNPFHKEFTSPRHVASFGGHRAWDRHFKGILARAGNAALAAEGYGASALTDPMDSRDPERAGYLNRPPEYLSGIMFNMTTYGGILTAPVSVMNTDHYEDVIETFGDDNTQEGRQIGEGQTIGTTKNPKFAEIIFKNFDYTSDDIVVTERQLDRSRFSIPSFVPALHGERLGRVAAKKLTNGLGVNEPHGIVKAAIKGNKILETAASGAIGYDDIVKLEYQLDEMFADGPGVGYMMHRSTLQALELIKDGQARPILQLGQEGTGNRYFLRGRPIYSNYQMDEIAASKHVILFGNFTKYVVRYAGSGVPRLIRDETTLRRELKVIFTTLMNWDGRLRDYGNPPLALLKIKA